MSSQNDNAIILYPAFEELPPSVKELLENGEEVIAIARTDLVGSDYGEELIALTNRRVVAVAESRGARAIPLAKVTAASIRGYINSCVLVIDTDEGSRGFAVFTRARLEAFEKFVTLTNNMVIGGGQYQLMRQVLDRIKRVSINRSGRAILVRLLGLLRPVMLLLISSILVAVVIRLLNMVPPYLMKSLIDEVLLNKQSGQLFYIIVGLLAVNLINTGLGTVNAYLNTKFNVVIANTLRSKIYSKLHELSLSHYDQFGSGGLWSRIMDDVGRVQWAMQASFRDLFINAATVAFIGFTLVTLNIQLTLIVLLPIPVSVTATTIYRRLSSRYYQRMWRRWSRIVSVISDTINAVILVRSYGKESSFKDSFEKYQEEFEKAQMDVFKFEQQIWPASGLAFTASSLLVWWIGGNQVLQGAISLGTLTAFTSYMWMFYSPVFGLIDNIKNLQILSMSASRIFDILDLEPDIIVAPEAKDVEIRGDVAFNNVWFTYDGIHYALRGVDIKIKPGERVGLVGPSGSGKTTLAKLLLRLYEPQLGSITYDGVDAKEVTLDSLKRQVAVVLQNPVLLDTTIAENISLGKNSVEPEEIIYAAKLARAHDFIMRFPEAYDFEVGMQGSRLSGGERARVALAAALLKNPKVLILDEPTAALDALTEDEVTEELERLTRGKTTIIIAHRLSTLRFVDRIIVMDKGIIVEEGSHEELLGHDGLYKKLWEAQLKGLTRMSQAEVNELYAAQRA